MKLAIMQPYLFPYLGYFQLISWAEAFVFYNDVQFIKGGWINRNTILVKGNKHLFTFSLQGASTFLNINERQFDPAKIRAEKKKFLKTIALEYAQAPYFHPTFKLIEEILSSLERNVAASVCQSLISISGYLGLKTQFIYSEKLVYDRSGSAQEKIIDICQTLNAKQYTNPIGGQMLYDAKEFSKNGIALNFIKPNNVEYKQFENSYVPNLSILDVMMFNSIDEVNHLLNQYQLIN